MTTSTTNTQRPSHSWTIPAPIKRLFDKFPLITYAENELPVRALRVLERRKSSDNGEGLHAFFSWTDEEEGGEGEGVASFNPGCLRWQVSL